MEESLQALSEAGRYGGAFCGYEKLEEAVPCLGVAIAARQGDHQVKIDQ